MPITPYQVQCFPDARCVSTGEASASYSTDNGLEWSPASLPAGPLAFLRSLGGLGSLSCSSSEACIAVSSSPGGGVDAVLLVSHNGGESWSSVEAHGLPAGKVFIGLACPTASECWMSGDVPVHLRDGGTVVGDTGGPQLCRVPMEGGPGRAQHFRKASSASTPSRAPTPLRALPWRPSRQQYPRLAHWRYTRHLRCWSIRHLVAREPSESVGPG